ncbi:hypothetical protein E4U56_007582 [Claviceps arundinis]|uniref:Uncharacterized protein n=1 Tax=Claviceps arundinis TaxID=1623583 RepID=A0A9P7MJX6_9HYPO|nr:hypothetical protein E4U56_007582 [Claviceps arundinis]
MVVCVRYRRQGKIGTTFEGIGTLGMSYGRAGPVDGKALFDAQADTIVNIAGRNAYKALKDTIKLVTLVRQSDTDASSIAFRRVLENLRQGNPDLTDFRTLEPRLLSRLERRERATFEEQAVYLFATRDSVHNMNYSRLRDANILELTSFGCSILELRSRKQPASLRRSGFARHRGGIETSYR